MGDKVCRKCGETKPIDNFSKDKKNKTDGHTNFCKSCIKEYYISNKERINAHNKKYYHNESKEQRAKRIARTKAWSKDNPDYDKERYLRNKDEWKKYNTPEKRQYSKEWKIKNKEKVKAYNKAHLEEKMKWQRDKMANDPKYRLDRAMSTAIRDVVLDKGGRSWEDLIDFTREELYAHIESLFVDGMSWDNYELWHIDHVIPKSWFKYNTPEDKGFKQAWSLDNLQPLWAIDNLRKGNSFAGRE